MKKLVLIAALAVATSAGYAQGQLNFSNYVPGAGLTPKIFQTDGVTPLDGSYLAQLYGGTDAASLTPLGTAATFKTGAGAGYFTGGGIAIPLTVIPNPAAGGVFEVKAWLATAGTSYEAALAAGANNTYGTSAAFTLASIATVPAPPSNLIGLASFNLVGVPEPSTLVLGALGASLFLLRRRS
jgi:hypothetical protein